MAKRDKSATATVEAPVKEKAKRHKGPSAYRVTAIKSVRFHNDALAKTEGMVPDIDGYLAQFAEKFGLKIRNRAGKNGSYSTSTFETEDSLNKASRQSQGPRVTKDALLDKLMALTGKTREQVIAEFKVNGES